MEVERKDIAKETLEEQKRNCEVFNKQSSRIRTTACDATSLYHQIVGNIVISPNCWQHRYITKLLATSLYHQIVGNIVISPNCWQHRYITKLLATSLYHQIVGNIVISPNCWQHRYITKLLATSLYHQIVGNIVISPNCWQHRYITKLLSTHYPTLHYITLSAFQTPLTPKVTSGASTITCYTKYSPPAQHAG